MNYLKGKWRKISPVLRERFPRAVRFYEGVMTDEESYADWLRNNLTSVASEFSFDLQVLF